MKKLTLLPNLLSFEPVDTSLLAKKVASRIEALTDLICENEKSARAYLKLFRENFREVSLHLYNEHTTREELRDITSQIISGGEWGLISDAGLPGIADPGSSLVFLARKKGIQIEAFAGPTSPILLLQLSGLSGQSFAFHGYLPKEKEAVKDRIRRLYSLSKEFRQTQICIETPYRSDALKDLLIENLPKEALLAIGISLTSPEERVYVFTVEEWKTKQIVIGKFPTIFAFIA